MAGLHIRSNERRILGIDPGLRKTGWGLICGRGNELFYEDSGLLTPPPNGTLEDRLAGLHSEMTSLVARISPDLVAMEETFVNRDPAGALKLGMARGICLAAVAASGYSVQQYAPNKVKKTVVGVGHADKAQIAAMVRVLLPRAPQNLPEDAADALAVAICHLNHL